MMEDCPGEYTDILDWWVWCVGLGEVSGGVGYPVVYELELGNPGAAAPGGGDELKSCGFGTGGEGVLCGHPLLFEFA